MMLWCCDILKTLDITKTSVIVATSVVVEKLVIVETSDTAESLARRPNIFWSFVHRDVASQVHLHVYAHHTS